ncbi:MAG TPA: pseudaminic acid biosynthesis-associated methylase [Solirubrobacter sp.]|nr:pseudaminic acid biosynthesis-associated methylase [Solirubrobacter sp.]
MPHSTEQEAFWAGSFGAEYTRRNADESTLASYTAMWSRILGRTAAIGSALELGCNAGLNLRALQRLLPGVDLHAVEINPVAVEEARKTGANVVEGSILEFQPPRPFDLVLICGVLIHIDPDSLGTVYELMHAASARYICLSEYFNPTPVEIPYRGHRDRLFKRDFAGELLDRYDDLRLVDYGFVYDRDPAFPQDNTTWFLLERR